MAQQKDLELLRQGVAPWNEWRKQHPKIQPDLSGVNLRGINLSDANLSGVNLRGINLSDANLYIANLSDANLTDSRLRDADLRGADLRGADLSHADLSHADLPDADLSGANLSRTNLSHTHLSGANLSGALMYRTLLDSVSLNSVNLNSANLRYAELGNTDLSYAELGGTDLSYAHLYSTTIADVDLCTVKGLAEIRHLGPSPVALYSVQLPQDGSALHFLRGAGVPNEWIDDYRMRIMHPIQYHSLFISYSGQDDTLARRLHADLQDHGVRCWFAPEDMKIGDKIRSRIDEAIHLQDKLLLILSAASVTSDWVEHEVEMALARERKEQRTMLFPLRVDRAILDQEDHGWPSLVRHQRHIGDFSNWTDPQAYQLAFKRLLADLKKTDEQQNRERKP